jgi:hypothetical protein
VLEGFGASDEYAKEAARFVLGEIEFSDLTAKAYEIARGMTKAK